MDNANADRLTIEYLQQKTEASPEVSVKLATYLSIPIQQLNEFILKNYVSKTALDGLLAGGESSSETLPTE